MAKRKMKILQTQYEQLRIHGIKAFLLNLNNKLEFSEDEFVSFMEIMYYAKIFNGSIAINIMPIIFTDYLGTSRYNWLSSHGENLPQQAELIKTDDAKRTALFMFGTMEKYIENECRLALDIKNQRRLFSHKHDEDIIFILDMYQKGIYNHPEIMKIFKKYIMEKVFSITHQIETNGLRYYAISNIGGVDVTVNGDFTVSVNTTQAQRMDANALY